MLIFTYRYIGIFVAVLLREETDVKVFSIINVLGIVFYHHIITLSPQAMYSICLPMSDLSFLYCSSPVQCMV